MLQFTFVILIVVVKSERGKLRILTQMENINNDNR